MEKSSYSSPATLRQETMQFLDLQTVAFFQAEGTSMKLKMYRFG